MYSEKQRTFSPPKMCYQYSHPSPFHQFEQPCHYPDRAFNEQRWQPYYTQERKFTPSKKRLNQSVEDLPPVRAAPTYQKLYTNEYRKKSPVRVNSALIPFLQKSSMNFMPTATPAATPAPSPKPPRSSYYVGDLSRALNNPYSEDYFDELFREQFHEFVKVLNKKFKTGPLERELKLSQNEHNKERNTLVLDLDETLVHSYNEEESQDRFDFNLTVNIGGKGHRICGFLRPNAKKFLEQVAERFQVIIYTASQTSYAEVIVNEVLDQENRLISHVLGRDFCGKSPEGVYYKDLRQIDRDPRRMIVVDNSPYSVLGCLQNTVPIIPFYDNMRDCELTKLGQFLRRFQAVDDVRPQLDRTFRLSRYEGKTSQEVFDLLYRRKYI